MVTMIAKRLQRPFQEWIDSLKDQEAQGRVLARLERVRLGDCKPVGMECRNFELMLALVIECISDRKAIRS